VSVSDVRDGMGQGRVLGADTALEQRMVDGVMTFDEVLRRMSRVLKSSQRQSSRVAIAKRDLEISAI